MARVLASLIDAVLAFLLASLLASSSGWYFAERAVVTFRIHAPDTVWNGPLPLVLGAVSTLSYGFAFALLLVLFGEALWGAAPGKLLTRRVIVAPDRASRWLRFGLKMAPWWLFCLALVLGRWELAAVAAACGVGLLLDLVLSACRGRPAVHDRVAGTVSRAAARSGQMS